jgi:hypothetical protein
MKKLALMVAALSALTMAPMVSAQADSWIEIDSFVASLHRVPGRNLKERLENSNTPDYRLFNLKRTCNQINDKANPEYEQLQRIATPVAKELCKVLNEVRIQAGPTPDQPVVITDGDLSLELHNTSTPC